jgi:hypothetical protein
MSQGTRGGWIWKLFVGVGVVVCVSLVGCNEVDKPKMLTKQPGAGLPGTPRLPGQPGSGVSGGNVNTQPLGGIGAPVGRTTNTMVPAGNSGFGAAGNGNTFVPAVGPNQNYQPIGAASVSPAAGMGAGASSGSFGGSPPPNLDAPGLSAPAAPGAANVDVVPPSSGPISPIRN